MVTMTQISPRIDPLSYMLWAAAAAAEKKSFFKSAENWAADS